MKLVELSQGKQAMVDDEDFERVSQFKWHAIKSYRNWYAARTGRVDGKRVRIWLHHFIYGSFQRIDHRDCDGLNNKKANLRPATRVQNAANRRAQKHSSQFKGVSWWNYNKKWAAVIQEKYLGTFTSELEAARAYNAAAIERFGEFALINNLEGK